MNSKYWALSKINITAILVALITLASIADTLPPQLKALAPWLTLAGSAATIFFRIYRTSASLTGAPFARAATPVQLTGVTWPDDDEPSSTAKPAPPAGPPVKYT